MLWRGDVIQMRKISRIVLFCFVFNLRSHNGEKRQFLMSFLNWRQVYHCLTPDEGWKNGPVTQILSTCVMLLCQVLISVLTTREVRIYDTLGADGAAPILCVRLMAGRLRGK